ncbi:hypothetical protein DSO57_1030284 [Entomophthora muscae]|uniref:Uncharacterized protein n=1 Tax=Entomophthora muscae TaxID=34485 RepID=A0ACC2SDL1_9FUNG|nr:hypothetical protein DSO57_1030284 [Entomophthora muscae]
MRNAGLVKSIRSLDLAEGKVETIETLRMANTYDGARAIDQVDGDLTFLREMLIGSLDMLLNFSKAQVEDG